MRILPPSPFVTKAQNGLEGDAMAVPFHRGWLRGRIDRLIAFSHCRIELSQFSFSQRSDAVSRLHQLALSLDQEAPSKVHAGEKGLAQILHFINAWRQTGHYFGRYGDYVQRAHGIDRWRQFREAWFGFFRQNQLPRHYYERHLFLEPEPHRWLDHIEHRQLTVLLGALNRRLPDHLLTNKLLFSEHCCSCQLASVPTLAAWNGEGESLLESIELPPEDLFAKPFADFGSAGVVLIPYDAAGKTYAYEGERLSAEALRVALSLRAIGRGCLLQPRLRNAEPGTTGGDDSDVANIRIVTGKLPDGEPCVIAAGIRLPSRFTEQGHNRRVLMAPISLSDGRMGTAYLKGTCGPAYHHHPDSGRPIDGVMLAHWDECMRLALDAHASCPWMPFVGWDVIDSDRGVVLLEANSYWGANVVQLPGAAPLGRTDFPEIYLAWLQYFEAVEQSDSSSA